MRVLTVLLALVAMPLLTSTAQEVEGGRRVRESDKPAVKAERHSLRSNTVRDGEADEARCEAEDEEQEVVRHDVKHACAPTDLPPPPPPPPPPSGSYVISGQVYLDATPFNGLSGWTVTLSGAVTRSATTDGLGNYSFTGLPAGTYQVCELVKTGYHETWPDATAGPSCSTGGFGWSVTLSATIPNAGGNSFGNLTP